MNLTRLFPARESEVYWVLLTLPNVFINQTHHAKAKTVLFDRGVVLGTGPGNPPAVQVWTGKTVRFGSRTVQ